MGIHCEINLFKPPSGAFKPGALVSGLIKYSVDEPTEFKKITVSLKGMGQLRIKDRSRRRNNRRHIYTATEDYVDVDNIVQEDTGNETPAGSYEINFRFNLPENIPSSLEYRKHITRYWVRCNIKYYIRIKFERPGWFTFAKHYKREINVFSGITPKLQTVPVIHGEQKKLTQLFVSNPSILNIKATILNSVIATGGKIELHYELHNDTNVVVKSVESKLVEVYTFQPAGHTDIVTYSDVLDTDSKSGTVDCGATQAMTVEINVPCEFSSLDYSEIVKRDYAVTITVELPMPHRDMILKIPVQIGDVNVPATTYDDPPPSYWEAMGEGRKDDDEDDGFDDEKGEKS